MSLLKNETKLYREQNDKIADKKIQDSRSKIYKVFNNSFWYHATFGKEKWLESYQKSCTESNRKEGISLYIHLPFCESLFTFCACHKHITKRHEVEETRIETFAWLLMFIY